jgi:hypothetical protein
VFGAVIGRVKATDIIECHRLDLGGAATRRRAVPMLVAEDQPRKGERGDRGRIVSCLQKARERFFAEPFQFFRREAGTHDHVRHQGQGISELRHRRGQPHGRVVECARRAELGAEKLNRVGELERGLVARAFIEHVGRHAGDAVLPGRIRGTAGADDHVGLDERHLVLFDDPHGQPVGQRLLLDWWELERRGRAWRGRRRAVRFLCRQWHACDEEEEHEPEDRSPASAHASAAAEARSR